MKRKVVIVGPAYPLRGGIANFNEALCGAFLAEGYDSEIVSFSLQYPSFLFPGKTQNESDTRPDPGLPVRSLINSVNPYTWYRAAAYINSRKPDYVIVRFWLPFMAMALGSILRLLKSGIKVIALVDNAVPHEKRPGDTALTKYFFKKCDAFVAMSQSVIDDLALFTKSPFKRLIPHPVYDIYGDAMTKEAGREALHLGQEEKYVLFFGFVRKYKGLHLLLEAMADPRLSALNVHLIVAGEFYDSPDAYLTQIDKLGLKDRVILHDHFIPANKITRYFCAADLVAQTYLSATQSGVTQIAYHFGRPMLVTDVGGLAEIVPHGKAGYVVSRDATAIANALVDFYESDRENEMARFVQMKAGDFTWQSMVHGIEELFTNLVSHENS